MGAAVNERKRTTRGARSGTSSVAPPALLGFAALLLEIAAGKDVSLIVKGSDFVSADPLRQEHVLPNGQIACVERREDSQS